MEMVGNIHYSAMQMANDPRSAWTIRKVFGMYPQGVMALQNYINNALRRAG